MDIPFVDLKKQYASIKTEIDEAIQNVINETAFIKGKYVAQFEEDYKKIYGVKHVISCANGTDAIYITLKALGIGPGDEVITVANTWISTAETISQTGAKPVFIAIAPWIRKIVKEKYIHSLKRYELLSKLRVVTNPINNYWIMNKYVGNKELNKIRLIYVGDFSERKNVPTIIKATHQLKKRGVDINLTIIGDKGGDEKIVKKLSNSYITFKGRINSKQKLLEEYRKANIFIMISHKETFGLVYLEALSQGLSLIYSKNTGIDGLFKEGEVGYGVNPKSAKDVADTVLKAHKNLQIMKNNTLKSVDKFSPKIIAEKILRLYN